MLVYLFAVRTTWVVILFVLVGISVIWFILRVLGDFVTWFREEIVADIRERRQFKRAQKAKRKSENKQQE